MIGIKQTYEDTCSDVGQLHTRLYKQNSTKNTLLTFLPSEGEATLLTLKTPSEMDVAPWIANWILTDGIRWYYTAFNCIILYLMVFNGIAWYSGIQ